MRARIAAFVALVVVVLWFTLLFLAWCVLAPIGLVINSWSRKFERRR